MPLIIGMLILVGLGAGLWGAVTFSLAETVYQQMVGLLLVLIGAVAGTGACVSAVVEVAGDRIRSAIKAMPEPLPSAPEPKPAAVPAPPMIQAAEEYFYSMGGQDHGPVTAGQLRTYHQSGAIRDDTLVVRVGASNWQTYRATFA